ncbi:MAG: 5'-nucleotidase C-terminal domain-containing protein [Mycobacterium leprae]
MRNVFRLFLAVALAVMLVLPANAESSLTSGSSTTITIIHDTHFHGNFTNGTITLAQKASVINDIRAKNPGALFVGVGDDLGTSLLSSEFKGSQMVDALNQMGLVVNAVGNHDFDMGPENFLERVKESKFPWVTANLLDKRTGDVFGKEAGVKSFTVVTVNNVKVGFTGLLPLDLDTVSSPGPNAQTVAYATAMEQVLPAMRQAGAQVTVLLSHICGPDADLLAAQVQGIDAIVGDHCAGVLDEPKMVGKTIISRVGDEFRYVGELNLQVQNGVVTGHTFTRHEVVKESKADDAINTLMNQYQAKLDANLLQVIGRTETPLDSMKATNRFRETGLANFIADACRVAVDADVALVNGGNIRANKIYQPGPLTKKDIIDILPFTNYQMKLAVTGQTLKDALELGVSTMAEGQGRFPQVSGISFRVDATAPAGQRVSAVKVGGKPLDLTATYTLSVNSFMATGGDGYTMLRDNGKVLIDAGSAPLVSTAVIDYVRKAGSIAPTTEGRILVTRGITMELGKPAFLLGTTAQALDVGPEMKEGKLYLPLRAIAELYGATIRWSPSARTATVAMPWGREITVAAGANSYIVADRLMVPAFTLEQLGVHVNLTGSTISLEL